MTGTMRLRPPLEELRGAAVLLDGRRVFPHTSWAIQPGEHWAIVGPNGSGKSALAMAVAGHLPVVDGDIVYSPGISLPKHTLHCLCGGYTRRVTAMGNLTVYNTVADRRKPTEPRDTSWHDER